MRYVASLAVEELIARLEDERADQLSVGELVRILNVGARLGLGIVVEDGVARKGSASIEHTSRTLTELLKGC